MNKFTIDTEKPENSTFNASSDTLYGKPVVSAIDLNMLSDYGPGYKEKIAGAAKLVSQKYRNL